MGSLGLLARFGVVGGSGVLVNLVTLVVLRRLGPHFDDAVVGLGSSRFHLRWYHVFSTDDSNGLRNRLYWSQLIVIALVMPVSFVLNSLWTFAAVRTGRLDLADPLFEETVV